MVTFAPDGMTGHPDHVAVSRAVVGACGSSSVLSVLLATTTSGWQREFAELNEAMGIWEYCGPPPPTPDELVWEMSLDADEIVRKRGALSAHASQTGELAALVGEATYRAWWRREFFRAPTPAEVRRCRVSLSDSAPVPIVGAVGGPRN